MPIWATLIAWLVRGERPSLQGTVALCLGIAGIVVLVGPSVVSIDMAKLPGVGFAFAAAMLFASGSVVNGRPLPLPPLASIAWQVGLGCLPLLLLGLAVERPQILALNLPGLAAMIYMVFVPMGLCFIMWFTALRHLSPVVASTGTLLVPIVGSVLAAIVFGEPLGARQVTAMVLTFTGVVLALAAPRRRIA
jgi:drug/metabolite transporter (DMT)-like permease